MTSNSVAWSRTISIVPRMNPDGSLPKPVVRSASGTVATRVPGTSESPDANVVTSWPRATSSLMSSNTTRSVPP